MGRVASSLSIVFPMWNEESSIHLAVEAALEAGAALAAAGDIDSYDIVIVDDASTDATGRLADELAAADNRIRVEHHGHNLGLGGSIKTGLAAASGELVLYTDADLPCDLLECLTRGVRLMRLYSADVVSAYRHDRTAEGPRRAVYSFVYNLMIRVAFGLRVRDINFAFKLLRRPVLDEVVLESQGSFIDAELLIRAHRLGFHIIQFGVDYFPRTRGVSTLSSGATIVRMLRELSHQRRQLTQIRPVLAGVAAAEEPAAERTTRSVLRSRRRKPHSPRHPDGRLLIVNADDYGLTEAVASGILRAHRDGIVTSTSVLVLAPAFGTAGKWLAEEERLGVGVHLAAVGEDPPLLGAQEIPSLVDRRGRLPRDWRGFLARAIAGRVDPEDLSREFRAQLEAVSQLGIAVTHVDTHQHLHLWPVVRDIVVDLAAAAGVNGIRVPRSRGSLKSPGISYLASGLADRAAARGLVFPGDAAGLDEAGHMDAAALALALGRLAGSDARAVELSAHPGEGDDPDRARYRWNYEWERELDALVSPAAARAASDLGFVLGNYRDLAERQDG
ncbi:MAG: ChbG/HpnK family deacetylase [Actinobacteria bacterium]|nr:ChbG/HpnK family deacetylase [Actinomycetota bacterium]MBW3650101.1 ChbG/HpnK family deacetylase [Actinomycetota bacterium]